MASNQAADDAYDSHTSSEQSRAPSATAQQQQAILQWMQTQTMVAARLLEMQPPATNMAPQQPAQTDAFDSPEAADGIIVTGPAEALRKCNSCSTKKPLSAFEEGLFADRHTRAEGVLTSCLLVGREGNMHRLHPEEAQTKCRTATPEFESSTQEEMHRARGQSCPAGGREQAVSSDVRRLTSIRATPHHEPSDPRRLTNIRATTRRKFNDEARRLTSQVAIRSAPARSRRHGIRFAGHARAAAEV